MPLVPFFGTVPGRWIAIAVYAVLLVAAAVLTLSDPAAWQRHALLLVAPAIGLFDGSFRLRRALLTGRAPTGTGTP